MESKTYGVVVGPHAKDLNMYTNDTLLLAFAEACRFIVTEGDVTEFDPALPHQQPFDAGAVWPGNGSVAEAKKAGTIKWKLESVDRQSSKSMEIAGGHSIVVSG